MTPARNPSCRAGLTVWFTGLSAAGKTTISRGAAQHLASLGYSTEILDSDILRKHLNRDLGFTKADRDENVRRIAWVAELLTRNGVIALVSAVSPYREARDAARRQIGAFAEVHVDAPLAVCEARDPIGLYRRLRAGEVQHIAGVDDPYEAPIAPDLCCHTDVETIHESTMKVVALVLRLIAESTAVPESA